MKRQSLEDSVSGTDMAGSKSRLRSHSIDLTNTSEFDAGLAPDDFYKRRLSPLRYRARALFLPLIKKETPVLAHYQEKIRTVAGDVYFPWTANLGSHTFYVLMLPFPVWFGSFEMLRDMVFVLGLGIYWTGFVKDWLCLPRPKSPPLHRITMSDYTTQEYGCPSSHSANAVATTIVALVHTYRNWDTLGDTLAYSVCALIMLYFTSLVGGRIYCGMHGFVDITVGFAIGTSITLVRLLFAPVWDSIIMGGNWLIPFAVIAFYYFSIYFHPVPIDACPCFDDSVAFMGVLMGLELTHWGMSIYDGTGLVSYSYEILGVWRSIARVVIGVVCVIVWKELVSKPLLTAMYSPLHHWAFPDITEGKAPQPKCGAMRDRRSLDIMIRMSAYAGVSIVAINSFRLMELLGCGV